MLDALRLDLRLSRRRLTRTPIVTITAILSLALGLAAALTMTGVLDSLLFRPPAGIRDPGRVVAVTPSTYSERASYPDYTDLRDGAQSFEAVGAFAVWQYTARVGDVTVSTHAMLASASLLPLLGISPTMGRDFSATEDRLGAPPVALITHAFWLHHLDGDAHVLGRTLELAGRSFAIIGVLPPHFTAPDLSPVDVVVPIANAPRAGIQAMLTNRDYNWARIVARLRPGVTTAQASAEATTIYRRANLGVDGTTAAMLAHHVVPVRSLVAARRDLSSPNVKISLWLTLLAGAVLLVACANVAGLFLARAVRERRELAIRSALGGTRARLAGGVLLDVALITLAGTLIAIVLAQRAGVVLTRVLLANTVAAPPLDARTVVAAVAVALITGAIAAAVPLARTWFLEPGVDLMAGSRTITGAHRRVLRLVLIVQLGLATVLAIEAALFAVSLRKATHIDLGYDMDHLFVADADLYAAGFSGAQAAAAVRRAVDAVVGVRGVAVAGMTNGAALAGGYPVAIAVPGGDALPRTSGADAPTATGITAHYLDALGVPLLRGRAMTEAEVAGGRAVMLVSERFAQRHWPHGNPIGQCVVLGNSKSTHAHCFEVVGVVGDRRPGPLATHGAAEVYVPLGSPLLSEAMRELFPVGDIFPGREVAFRVTGDPVHVVPAVRAALLEALPRLTSVRVRTGHAYVERLFRAWRLGAGVLGVFGALALTLGAVGVFAMSSHVVAQRSRELGVRGALGARPVDLALLVAKESTGVALAGVVLGTLAALGVARITRTLVFGISPLDPRLFVVAGIALLLAALLATLRPAKRAASADPAVIMRSE